MAVRASSNTLWYGDNLEILQDNVADESVDLVYLDPPFNSNQAYNVIFAKHPDNPGVAAAQVKAFDDAWHWGPVTDQLYQRYALAGDLPTNAANALKAFNTLLDRNDAMAYLVNMAPRLVELHRVLKPTGSLYLHCDPTMSHYLKILLDAIFGAENFRSEIIWKRSSAHNSAKRFGPVHDTLLFYTVSDRYTWNPAFQPLPQETIDQWYNNVEEGTGRRFNRDNLTAPGTRSGPSGAPWRGIDPSAKGRHWAVPGFVHDIVAGLSTAEALDALDAAGRLFWPKRADGIPMLKRYLDESKGIPAQDVIMDVSPLNNVAAEREGYPTQKPLALLKRIISASSNRGDLILDAFCGCGTAIDAAESLGRNWIGIDIAYIAIDIIRKRLTRNYGTSVSYTLRGNPRDLEGADDLAERDKFEFQTWAVLQLNAEPSEQRSRDRGVDGIASFYIDRNATGRVIISVKGGGNVKPEYVRELHGTVATEKAQMGVLIMRSEPTAGMRDAANRSGTYTWPLNGQTYPKIQIVTVTQLFDGIRPVIPTQITLSSRRARPANFPDAATLLSGRVLIHARPVEIEPLLGLVNTAHSGLILTGTTGMRMADARRRAAEVDCPIIFDPASYLTWKATPQDPFRTQDGPLQGRTLNNFLRNIAKAGASAVFTPTGYIDVGDIPSLAAVLNAAPTLGSQAVVSLPLDISWVTAEWVDILIDMASSTSLPKAIMFNRAPRKPGSIKEVLVNLRLIATEIPQVGFFRSDLTVFDLMAHGALAASIGSSSALRKILPPNNRNLMGKAPEEEEGPSAEVLVGDLMSYLPGDVLATRISGMLSPVCHCRYCGGRLLSRFTGRAEWGPARLHNFAVWTEWLPGLLSDASPANRQLSWNRLCQRAVEAHDSLESTKHGNHFAPGLPLLFWAGELPIPPTLAAMLRSRRAGSRKHLHGTVG